MYKNLYENFKHWFHNDRGHVFFYSDPHFGDDKSSEFRKAHGSYVSDSEQLKRINRKVGKYDTIVFLGDIGNTELIPEIKGYKVLVMGNHDKGISNYRRCKSKSIDNHLFDEVYEGYLTISSKIILSHEPIDVPLMINVHGHKHNLSKYYDSTHINMCAEAIDYNPVSLKEIIKRGFSFLKNIEMKAAH